MSSGPPRQRADRWDRPDDNGDGMLLDDAIAQFLADRTLKRRSAATIARYRAALTAAIQRRIAMPSIRTTTRLRDWRGRMCTSRRAVWLWPSSTAGSHPTRPPSTKPHSRGCSACRRHGSCCKCDHGSSHARSVVHCTPISNEIFTTDGGISPAVYHACAAGLYPSRRHASRIRGTRLASGWGMHRASCQGAAAPDIGSSLGLENRAANQENTKLDHGKAVTSRRHGRAFVLFSGS